MSKRLMRTIAGDHTVSSEESRTDTRWLSFFIAAASREQRACERGTEGKYSEGAARRERVWCVARRVTFVKEGCERGWAGVGTHL